jgi:hypothetical protein
MNSENLVPAKFYFDESEFNKTFIGLHNPQRTWNGWEMPLISIESINDLISELNGDYYQLKLDGDKIEIGYSDDLETIVDILEPIEIGEKIYYDFAWLGLCFQSK